MLLVFKTVSAQQDVSFSHYWAMEPSFNPAAAGKSSVVNVAGAYAMSMAGFEHNPKTMYVGADLPFYFINNYHGVGVQLLNDDIGLFKHQRLALQYAYQFKLMGGVFSIGLQGGMLSEKFKGSELDVEVSDDKAFSQSDVNGTALDLAAGVYYRHGNWYAGASIQHATAPSVELGDRSIIDISRTYYLTGGYNIKLRNPFLSIPVSVLGMSDGVSYRGDVTARLVYTTERRTLMAGVGYSPTNSVTVMVGGSFHGINVGYSYEAYTNGISLGNGSHELFVSYQTDLNLYKKGKNKHKSVRLL